MDMDMDMDMIVIVRVGSIDIRNDYYGSRRRSRDSDRRDWRVRWSTSWRCSRGYRRWCSGSGGRSFTCSNKTRARA
jgi:hypothetical protein